MTVVRVGSLVRAIGEPMTNANIDYEALGVVLSINGVIARVKWPNVEKDLDFSIYDLLSIVGYSANDSESGDAV